MQKSETEMTEAENLIAEAKSKAAADADRLCELAKAEGSKELDKAKSEADRQCAVLSQTADKNRKNVIKNAVNLLSKY
ncbi:MAG: hypothetical protein LUF33_08130 [Clostridiales bacterium]|nr:hypothetical protein [Clostridiales bacterium]